nr:reverse transcriptase domain-containing protein [Tanacetum cinerariifolium]
MADNRTMAELLQAPTEGYEDAIVILEIATNNFELMHAWDPFNDLLRACPHHGFFELHQLDTFYNALNVNDHDSLNSAAAGNFLDKMPRECLKIIESKSKVHQSRAKAVVAKVGTSSSTPAISSKVFELKDMVRALLLDTKNQSLAPAQSSTPAPVKGITTRSGAVYQGPPIPTQSKVVKQETEVTKDQVQTPSSQSTAPVQPKTLTPVSEPVAAPVNVPIPYPSRRNNERRRDQANEQIKKLYEIFKEMSFEISFADALILMPKFASTLKALIRNKEKLGEMARTLMNEHCSAVILNKLPRKLGDRGKFLIPCEFPRMDECLALADLSASINLMPLSMWEGLSLPKLTSTCMTLELADRSVSKPIGIAKDVSVKVGVFHFPTGRALIDVQKGELTLRIGNEAITYNLDHTVRYSANYNQMTTNKIDVICEMYSQEVLGFSDVTMSGNPTHYDDPIVLTTSPTLIPFGDSDFLHFEEADAFLGLEDDPDSPKINPFYYDPEGDILFLEAILNTRTVKSFVDEPLEVELKDLPPHLEYAFLEGNNKLPIIIAKELGYEEKSSLIKILMEENNKPAVQHQRRVNPKIHDVIKKEVEKLLDAGLIYPISDSPWVSPVHCVPKKGGFTVVENEENELIPTRLVTGWRVCIDYRKLNEATRKDHFPLPFMDHMLERLARNKYYCSSMVSPGIFKFPLTLVIRKRQRSPAHTARLPIDACPSVCAMHRARFKDKMLQRCEDTNLSLNWEKSHFMVKEGIVLGHKVSKNRIEVDRAKVDVIAKLPYPTTVKEVKEKTRGSHNLDCPKLDLPFKLMYDASYFAIGAVLGKRHEKHFKPIYYDSKTMNDAESNYTTIETEMLAVVYAFKKFQSYLIMNKSIVYTDHSALEYLFAKKDAKARLLRWGIDFMDPFPSSRRNKYILVAVDYLSKWVKAKALSTNDARVVCKFLKSLFARFGSPRAIISDRGTHFCNDQFAKVMLKYGVTHRLSTAYHPQSSGQVEVSNRGLKRILERTIGENRASWSDKLDDAL